jgi:polyhydroxyalkanoate synthesis regulator phasin
MKVMLDFKAKNEIDQLNTKVGKMASDLNEGKGILSAIKRRVDSTNDEFNNKMDRAIRKIAEAEEALRVAKSRLQELP